eukprot:1430115-Ditylum_brightwellii.AAC.1
MLMTIKQLNQQIKPSAMPTKQHAKPKELLHREPQKGKRKKDQRGINKPPVVPISHPTHHNNTHQNGPNSGSEGEECPAMEHRRSKVGHMPKEISTEPKPVKERMSTDEPMNEPIILSATNLERLYKRTKP